MENQKETQTYYRVVYMMFIDDEKITGTTEFENTAVYNKETAMYLCNILNKKNQNPNSCYSVKEVIING